MSAEIAGFESRDNHIVAQIILTAAAVDVETGADREAAYNNRGATYAAKFTLVALRRMGVIDGEIDLEVFDRHLMAIEDETLLARSKTTLERTT